LYLFADDAKMYCHIKDLADKDKLQRGIEKSVTWTNKWQVSLNINKCKIMPVHQRRYSNMGVSPNYVMNNTTLEEVTEIKDLGVCFNSLIVFDKHIFLEKINKAYTMLGIIKRHFAHISRNSFVTLYNR